MLTVVIQSNRFDLPSGRFNVSISYDGAPIGDSYRDRLDTMTHEHAIRLVSDLMSINFDDAAHCAIAAYTTICELFPDENK